MSLEGQRPASDCRLPAGHYNKGSTLLNQTIVVADDHTIDRDRLAKLLREEGLRVICVRTTEACLQAAEQHQVDAFLLDFDLPGEGGISLSRRIRALPDHRVTPILILTERSQFGGLSEAFSSGSDDMLVKPVDPVILKARLSGAMARLEYVRRLDKMQKSLARYVSPRTQEMLEASHLTGELPPPEEQELCLLFTDIRGFTEISQQADPTQLFTELSQQLSKQVEAVYRHGGYIDKFGGDGVMAVFDGPNKEDDACRCALEIIASARQGGTKLSPHGLLPLGIGVHVGPAVVGNIGWAEHLDYSAIGASVNLAARLCGYADPLTIIISESVYRRVDAQFHGLCSRPMSVILRGVMKPVTVYKLGSDIAQHRTSETVGE